VERNQHPTDPGVRQPMTRCMQIGVPTAEGVV
jgi:hypothetical protein